MAGDSESGLRDFFHYKIYSGERPDGIAANFYIADRDSDNDLFDADKNSDGADLCSI